MATLEPFCRGRFNRRRSCGKQYNKYPLLNELKKSKKIIWLICLRLKEYVDNFGQYMNGKIDMRSKKKALFY